MSQLNPQFRWNMWDQFVRPAIGHVARTTYNRIGNIAGGITRGMRNVGGAYMAYRGLSSARKAVQDYNRGYSLPYGSSIGSKRTVLYRKKHKNRRRRKYY